MWMIWSLAAVVLGLQLILSFCCLYHAFKFGNKGDSTYRMAYIFIGVSAVLLVAELAVCYEVIQNI